MNRFLQILLPQCDASTRVWLSSFGTSSVLHVLAGAALATWLGSVAPQLFPPRQGFNSIQLTASQMIEVEPTEATDYDSPPVAITASSESAILVAAAPEVVRRVAAQTEVIPATTDGELAASATTADRVQFERTSAQQPPEVPSESISTMPRSRQATKPPTASPSVASISSQQDSGQLDSIPTKIFSPQPEYPVEALQQELEGRVVLRVAIDSSGKVTAASVLRSSGYANLDQAAHQTVKRWRFDPPRRLGIAVRTEIAVPINFQIVR